MRVTAIVSVYNGAQLIEGCLEDLVQQTLFRQGGLDILVIDSASTEDVRALVEPYVARSSNIQFIRTTERETLYATWNRGLELANTEFVTNANVDDRHAEHALELLGKTLRMNPEIDLVYADVYRSDVPNARFDQCKDNTRYEYAAFQPTGVLFHYQFGCQPLWKRRAHDDAGKFDPVYKAAGDWDFNFRFNLAGCKAIYLAEPLGVFFENSTSISRTDDASMKEQHEVQARYLHIDSVLMLCRAEGIACSSSEEKRAALKLLSGRARNIRLPWEPGKVFCNEAMAAAFENAPL